MGLYSYYAFLSAEEAGMPRDFRWGFPACGAAGRLKAQLRADAEAIPDAARSADADL
jgi:hypothetical protein